MKAWRIPRLRHKRSRRTSTTRIERWWQAFSVLSIASLSTWYFTEHWRFPSDRHTTMIFTLGWIGIALSILAAGFSVRKRLQYQAIGKLSIWLKAHLYMGLIAAFAIFFHANFSAGSLLTGTLLTCFSIAVVSGVLGWLIALKTPPLLTAIEEKPAIMEDLIAVRADCIRGMLELAAGGSNEFRSLVERRVVKESVSWSRILRFYRKRSNLREELAGFRNEYAEAMKSLKVEEHPNFLSTLEHALRANKMNAELFLQRLMRSWLTLHVVSTTLMFGLAAIHVFSVLYY